MSTETGESRQGKPEPGQSATGKIPVTIWLLLCLCFPLEANAQSQFELNGVWVLLQHDRPGGLFGAPRNPDLSPAGKKIVDEFLGELADDAPERGAYCVPSGMPESVFGIAGYPIDIIQRPERITLISEFQSEVRRIYLDGRAIPDNYPHTRNGYSIGEWRKEAGRDVLYVTTKLIKAWEVDKWVHSEQVVVEEILSLRAAASLAIPDSEVSINDVILENRITVTDPVMYTRPQTLTVWYRQVPDSDLLEYNCPEYNWRRALEAD